MKYTDEDILLERLKKGEENALEVIFNRYYGNLCKYLLLLFKNKIIVEHIAQDIFIYLWENRDSLDIKLSLESYIYTAGRYKALNQIRNRKRQECILNEIGYNQSNQEDIPFISLETQDLQKIIDDAIIVLPEKCQQIFRLSRDEGMSHKEIAKILGISVNTVEGQITIALKKLRKQLKVFNYNTY